MSLSSRVLRAAGITAPAEKDALAQAMRTPVGKLTDAQLALVRRYNREKPGNREAARRLAERGES
jgi:hypothetical protein